MQRLILLMNILNVPLWDVLVIFGLVLAVPLKLLHLLWLGGVHTHEEKSVLIKLLDQLQGAS